MTKREKKVREAEQALIALIEKEERGWVENLKLWLFQQEIRNAVNALRDAREEAKRGKAR